MEKVSGMLMVIQFGMSSNIFAMMQYHQIVVHEGENSNH